MLFPTPILPCGRVLRLEILSTWGDQYYVGLNGIDIFDQEGKLISMARGDMSTIEKVAGNPRSINVLTGMIYTLLHLQHIHNTPSNSDTPSKTPSNTLLLTYLLTYLHGGQSTNMPMTLASPPTSWTG